MRGRSRSACKKAAVAKVRSHLKVGAVAEAEISLSVLHLGHREVCRAYHECKSALGEEQGLDSSVSK